MSRKKIRKSVNHREIAAIKNEWMRQWAQTVLVKLPSVIKSQFCATNQDILFSLWCPSCCLTAGWARHISFGKTQVPTSHRDIFTSLSLTRSRSQDGYCEYMADGTKALLLKKIFSEAEKVMIKYSLNNMMTVAMNVTIKCHLWRRRWWAWSIWNGGTRWTPRGGGRLLAHSSSNNMGRVGSRPNS